MHPDTLPATFRRMMRRARFGLVATVVVAGTLVVAAPAPAEATTASWLTQVAALVRGKPVSVSIGVDGAWLYRRGGAKLRTPASNEKLLLSMALLDRIDPTTTIPTKAAVTTPPVEGLVRGNLWIIGRGNPEIGRADMAALAAAIVATGVRRIRGSVIGDEGPFARDDFATGWLSYFPATVIPLATALTYHGNVNRHWAIVRDPERRAAAALTAELKKLGVRVSGKPSMGYPTKKLVRLATIDSAPLGAILGRMDRDSINFDAEVLAKYLGQAVKGAPGRIAKGAAAIRAFAAAQGAPVTSYDGSGLSYADRVTTDGIVRLLWYAGAQPWGPTLRDALASGGEGTLEGRFPHVILHAKTGTLDGISALSGWVWLEGPGAWAEFSILSRGMTKAGAVVVENKIVGLVARGAELPAP